MDVSRLLEVVTDIEQEFQGGYSEHLQVIVQAYTSARDNPSQDLSEQISVAHAGLAEYIGLSIINDYPPSKQRILDTIGGSGLVGEEADRALHNRLSAVGVTGAALVTEATAFVSECERFRNACAQTKAGLLAIGIEPHHLAHGECEVGILIPESLINGTLAGLQVQLKHWNTILKGFSELAGDREREIPLKGLASSSPELYGTVGFLTATLLAYAIDKTLDWYKKILEIQEVRKRLANLGVPVIEPKLVMAHEKQLLDEMVVETVRDLLGQAKPKLSGGRKEEIETQVTLSVKKIARFIDRGGDVEVTVGAPEVPDEPVEPEGGEGEADRFRREYLPEKKNYEKVLAEATEARKISRQGAALRSLPPRKEPILQLGNVEEAQDQSQKTTKAEKK